jgi:hypothetical protein
MNPISNKARDSVLKAIADGWHFAKDIQTAAKTEYRETDKTLQALKRAGKIKYTAVKDGGRGWVLV